MHVADAVPRWVPLTFQLKKVPEGVRKEREREEEEKRGEKREKRGRKERGVEGERGKEYLVEWV